MKGFSKATLCLKKITKTNNSTLNNERCPAVYKAPNLYSHFLLKDIEL